MLWNRAELKGRAKNVLRGCFWSAVVVCLISGLLNGEFGGGANGSVRDSEQRTMEWEQDEDDAADSWWEGDDAAIVQDESLPVGVLKRLGAAVSGIFSLGIFPILIYMGLLVALVTVLISLFIGMPVLVGANRFFMQSREQKSRVGELLYVYRSGSLGNVVLTMIIKGVKIFLWSLLLLIPGIVKGYEYQMVSYILSENPGIDRKRAFELSAQMMDGQKWNAFILDLSFFPWLLLGAVTCGLSNIFFVNPYMAATSAELYAVLREEAIRSGFTNTYELPGFYDGGGQM